MQHYYSQFLLLSKTSACEPSIHILKHLPLHRRTKIATVLRLRHIDARIRLYISESCADQQLARRQSSEPRRPVSRNSPLVPMCLAKLRNCEQCKLAYAILLRVAMPEVALIVAVPDGFDLRQVLGDMFRLFPDKMPSAVERNCAL